MAAALTTPERAVVLFLRLWLVVMISIAIVSVSAVVLVWLRLPRVLVIAPIGSVIFSASLASVGLACLHLQRAGNAPRIVEGRYMAINYISSLDLAVLTT